MQEDTEQREVVIPVQAEFVILPDRKQVQILFHFDGDPEPVREWLKFAYCQELKWMVHAMRGDSSDVWMSMLKVGLK